MRILSSSYKDTTKIGAAIARDLEAGDIICLFGGLGSGKTVLTKGIAQGLGVKSNRIVSPSFILLRQHTQGRLPLYHFDLYRLKTTRDIAALGYEDYFYGDGVAVIEWADRLKYLMPKEYLKIKISIKSDSQRLFEFSAFGRHYEEQVSKLIGEQFLLSGF